MSFLIRNYFRKNPVAFVWDTIDRTLLNSNLRFQHDEELLEADWTKKAILFDAFPRYREF